MHFPGHGYPKAFGTLKTIEAQTDQVFQELELALEFPEMENGGLELEGLAVHQGWICCENSCGYITTSEVEKRVHKTNRHEDLSVVEWQTCLAQRFNGKSSYFTVQRRTRQAKEPSGVFQQFQKKYLSKEHNTLLVPNATHTRDIPPFINSHGFFAFLKPWYEETEKRKSVVALYTLDKTDTAKKLLKLVTDYISDVSQEALGKNFQNLRPFEVYPV